VSPQKRCLLPPKCFSQGGVPPLLKKGVFFCKIIGFFWGESLYPPAAFAKEILGMYVWSPGDLGPLGFLSKGGLRVCRLLCAALLRVARPLFLFWARGFFPMFPVENAIHLVNECKRVSKRD